MHGSKYFSCDDEDSFCRWSESARRLDPAQQQVTHHPPARRVRIRIVKEQIAEWYHREANDLVQCDLCPHGCLLEEGAYGVCGVRKAVDGTLRAMTWGRPCAIHVDPIEKKPLYHFLPGSQAFSIATVGCNLHCLNCQNAEISQAAPDEASTEIMAPESLVAEALAQRCHSIAYTYTEPIIFYEYTCDIATLARARGLKNILVTAGYINPEPLRKLCRLVDAANVDLKGFDEKVYLTLNAVHLEPVLRALEIMREEGLWIEVSNLMVPTYTDDLHLFRKLCRWVIEHLGQDTPLHVLRFFPAYKLLQLPPTPEETISEACAIARDEGLRFVYAGNTSFGTTTYCPSCRQAVIKRSGFGVRAMSLIAGRCRCGQQIPGVW